MDYSPPVRGDSPGNDAGVGCHFPLHSEGRGIHNTPSLQTGSFLSWAQGAYPQPETAPPENTCRGKRTGSQGLHLYHPELRDGVKAARGQGEHLDLDRGQRSLLLATVTTPWTPGPGGCLSGGAQLWLA